MRLRIAACVILGATWGCAQTQDPQSAIKQAFIANAVQVAPLDALKPLFVPTHPRVTTTIRFPGVIAAPMGNGFTEDPSKVPGEYVVSWVEGEPHFTVTPVEGAGPCNLNVPYKGQIYVLYFYPVATQPAAVAVLNLAERAQAQASVVAKEEPQVAPVEVKRQSELPPPDFVPVTPARLLGFMDKLKVLHATALGPELEGLSKSMQCEVAVSKAELDAAQATTLQGVAGVIRHGVNDAGLYQLILVRAVRDRRLNCVGFICLIRNVSDVAIAFDTASFAARSGATILPQVLTDSPAVLAPGEQAEAYFIVQGSKAFPVLAQNEWRLSVELLSPRLNPGASIAGKFMAEQKEASR